MEFNGKFEKALDIVKGKSAKGEWVKQDFIFKTTGQYPKSICVTNWNNKVDVASLIPGEEVKVLYDLESREYNGRWYTNVTMWRIERNSGINVEGEPSKEETPFPTDEPDIDYTSQDDLPF